MIVMPSARGWVNRQSPVVAHYIRAWWNSLQNLRRPAVLILITVASILLTYISMPTLLTSVNEMGFRKGSAQNFDWRAFAPILFAIMSAPIWFVLWFYKDSNSAHKLRIETRDSDLTYFQNLQKQAVGEPDEDQSPSHTVIIQRAAINSMEPFLIGTHSKFLQRPAFDTLMAISEMFNKVAGSDKILTDLIRLQGIYERRVGRSKFRSVPAEKLSRFIFNQRQKFRLVERDVSHLIPMRLISRSIRKSNNFGNIDSRRIYRLSLYKARFRSIFTMRSKFLNCYFARCKIYAHGFGNAYFACTFDETAFIGCDLSHAVFFGSHFGKCTFVGANLNHATMPCCIFFERADFRCVEADGADFRGATFHRANFRYASLVEAKFNGADLKDADFRGADLRGIDPAGIRTLRGAQFDDLTYFSLSVGRDGMLTEIDRDAAKEAWLERSTNGP